MIVTFNSQKVLSKAMKALSKQTYPIQKIILVDTGSEDPNYLNDYKDAHILFAQKNGGFCLGNNVGYHAVPPDSDYVLLLNPDAFLFEDFIEVAVKRMEQDSALGAVTGVTYGYDLVGDVPNGRYDTTGIFQTWYGKWFDRGQGELITKQQFIEEERVQAICGAVFFVRKKALDTVLLQGKNIFNPRFYMYKEDIDLSLRLSKQHWKLFFVPSLRAYHCRGWQGKRSNIPRRFREISAKNELSINFSRKNPLPILYSVLKWTVVKLLNV